MPVVLQLDELFNRPDSVVVGNGWLQPSEHWAIVGNRLKTTHQGFQYYSQIIYRPSQENGVDMRIVAHDPEGRVNQFGSIYQDALAVRRQGNGDRYDANLSLSTTSPEGNSVVINKWIAGSVTTVTSWNINQAIDHSVPLRLEFSAEGINPTTLKFEIYDDSDDTLLFSNTVQDSTAELQSAGACGIVCYVGVSYYDRVTIYSDAVPPGSGLEPPSISLDRPSQTAPVLSTGIPAGAVGQVALQWHRGLTADFTPDASNDIVGATGLIRKESGLTPNTTYHYKVVATDDETTTVSEVFSYTTWPANRYAISAVGNSLYIEEDGGLTVPGRIKIRLEDDGDNIIDLVNRGTGSTTAIHFCQLGAVPHYGWSGEHYQSAFDTIYPSGATVNSYMQGTNDWFDTKAEFKLAVLSHGQGLWEQAGIKTVLHHSPYGNYNHTQTHNTLAEAIAASHIPALNDAIDELCVEYPEFFIQGDQTAFETFFNGRDTLFDADGLHINTAGAIVLEGLQEPFIREALGMIPNVAPSAPTILAQPNGAIKITVTAPADLDTEGVRISRDGGSPIADIPCAPGQVVSYIDTDRTFGQSHDYTATAYDATGLVSVASVVVTATAVEASGNSGSGFSGGYRPGDEVIRFLTTRNGEDLEEEPTAVLWRGLAATTIEVDIQHVMQGDYAMVCDIPDGWTVGDNLRLKARVVQNSKVEYYDFPLGVLQDGAAVVSLAPETEDKITETHAKVLSLGAATLVVRSPVLSDGSAEIVRGGDYYLADGRALSFEITGSGIESLPISSIDFIVHNRATLEKLAVPYTEIEDGIRVDVELSRTDTRALQFSDAKFYIEIKLTNGHELPQLEGDLTIRDGGE